MACYCMGLQLSYILGWCLSYRYILWVNLALSILNLAMLMTITESPVFLMRQNREEVSSCTNKKKLTTIQSKIRYKILARKVKSIIKF